MSQMFQEIKDSLTEVEKHNYQTILDYGMAKIPNIPNYTDVILSRKDDIIKSFGNSLIFKALQKDPHVVISGSYISYYLRTYEYTYVDPSMFTHQTHFPGDVDFYSSDPESTFKKLVEFCKENPSVKFVQKHQTAVVYELTEPTFPLKFQFVAPSFKNFAAEVLKFYDCDIVKVGYNPHLNRAIIDDAFYSGVVKHLVTYIKTPKHSRMNKLLQRAKEWYNAYVLIDDRPESVFVKANNFLTREYRNESDSSNSNNSDSSDTTHEPVNALDADFKFVAPRPYISVFLGKQFCTGCDAICDNGVCSPCQSKLDQFYKLPRSQLKNAHVVYNCSYKNTRVHYSCLTGLVKSISHKSEHFSFYDLDQGDTRVNTVDYDIAFIDTKPFPFKSDMIMTKLIYSNATTEEELMNIEPECNIRFKMPHLFALKQTCEKYDDENSRTQVRSLNTANELVWEASMEFPDSESDKKVSTMYDIASYYALPTSALIFKFPMTVIDLADIYAFANFKNTEDRAMKLKEQSSKNKKTIKSLTRMEQTVEKTVAIKMKRDKVFPEMEAYLKRLLQIKQSNKDLHTIYFFNYWYDRPNVAIREFMEPLVKFFNDNNKQFAKVGFNVCIINVPSNFDREAVYDLIEHAPKYTGVYQVNAIAVACNAMK
jgi:hypothetical protein